MAVLEFIYRYGIAFSALMFCLGAALLVWCIVRLVRVVKASVLIRLPLVETQMLTFNRPGPVVLCVEGPRFTTRFFMLSYELLSDKGVPVPCRRALFRSTTSSFTTVRMEARRLVIPLPGDYTLRVGGLGEPRAGDEKHHLVFVEPHLRIVVACIFGIIFSAGLVIGGLVFFILRLVGL